MHLTAESVETKESNRWLLDNGCDYLQGYLISKPIKVDEIPEYIVQEYSLPRIERH